MDRRQQRTRRAIFEAFSVLLAEKSYSRITISDIIEKADIGRSTFYDNFDTKDSLLQALCSNLFDHVIGSALDSSHIRGLYSDAEAPSSVCLHIFQHLQENSHDIMRLFCGENNELFMRYFRSGLMEVTRKVILPRYASVRIPEELMVSHIAGTFVNMLTWWTRRGMTDTPQQLDAWMKELIEPVLLP